MDGPKQYFVSHSSADKPLAVELKGELDGNAWVDLHEIEVGDILLQEISDGIQAASDFVVLWSSASAASKWVQFEFNMAFIRYLEDNAIAIRIIRLDETPVPLHFRPFLHGKNLVSAQAIAQVLLSTSHPAVSHRTFINRNVEIGRIEDALHDPSIAFSWISGLPGAGKKALASESVRRLTSGTASSRSIRVTPGIAEPELALLLASATSTTAPPPSADFAEIDEFIAGTLRTYSDGGGTWVFQEAEYWLEDDGSLGRMARKVVDALRYESTNVDRLAIFTSRRKPSIDPALSGAVSLMSLRGLAPMHGVALLRALGGDGDASALREVTEGLEGHPLALEIVAPLLPVSPEQVAQYRLQIATDLISQAALSEATWKMLEALSVIDGLFSVEDLAQHLGFSSAEIGETIAEAVSYGLTEYSEAGHLTLHPLVREFYLRSFRKHPGSKDATSALASLSKARLQSIGPTDPHFVPSLLTTFKLLGLAGRFDEARSLRSGLIGVMLSIATELYQTKRYDESLVYLDESLTGNRGIDRDALLLKAKCLAYLGRIDEARELADELLIFEPASARVLRDRGRIEYIAKNWARALSFFDKALSVRPNNPSVLTAIAQVQVRQENWEAAGAAARKAIDLKGDTPYTLSLYSQVLEHQQRFAEAQSMIERAIQREPRNAGFRHRLGRIAQLSGDRTKALEQFQSSVELDPNYQESWLSLASIQADLADFIAAEESLARAQAIPGVPMGVVLNVKAKICLQQGNPRGADENVRLALSHGRDKQNLALAIRVQIALGESGAQTLANARAEVRLLAKELDSIGHLADVVDVAQRYPQYF